MKRLESQIILKYLGARKLNGIKMIARISLLDTRLHRNLMETESHVNWILRKPRYLKYLQIKAVEYYVLAVFFQQMFSIGRFHCINVKTRGSYATFGSLLINSYKVLHLRLGGDVQ